MKTLDSLGLCELAEYEKNELNAGCEYFCIGGFMASFSDGFESGWNSAKASWDRTVEALK